MAKICTQCGAELSDDIRFCTECGAPLPEGTAPQTENKPEEKKETVTVAAPAQPEPAPAPEPAPTPAPPPPPPVQTPPPRQTPPPQQPVYQQQVYQQPVYQQPVYAAPAAADDRPAKGSKYEPISTGGFIGIMLLLCIPIVGLILMIVWACGGCRKVTKRAMARAMLIITVIMLVLAIIFGVAVKGVINKAMKEIGIEDGGSGIGSLFGGRDKDKDDGLGGLLGALGSLSGDDSGDLGELGELGELFSALEELEGLTGEDMTGDLGGLLGQAEDANKEANSKADGWPRGLREYPGEIVSVSAARSEVHNTTREEMLEYIDDLKADGFKFQDFYDFGFTEEDMLGMDGWWATDGDIYLSLAYYDGTVTIDHTYELPDYGF